jgi:hypothetical protein
MREGEGERSDPKAQGCVKVRAKGVNRRHMAIMKLQLLNS